MKTRNLILPGIALVVLAILATTVSAGMFEIEAPKGPHTPQVYLLKKVFDICDPGLIDGGSVPPSGRQYGCVDFLPCNLRWNEYAFTGERIAELVAVRDLAGAIDIAGADMYVGSTLENSDPIVQCNEITLGICDGTPDSDYDSCDDYDPPWVPDAEAAYICPLVGCTYDDATNLCSGGAVSCENLVDKAACEYVQGCDWELEWYHHEIDLTQIPEKGPAPEGFDPLYDKIYECILTVTNDMGAVDLTTDEEVYGRPDGTDPSIVFVAATDKTTQDPYSNCGISPTQEWYFNPAIEIVIDTSDGGPISFEEPFGMGQTVYSTNALKIKNEAEGGVDLFPWIAASDLTSPTQTSKCPISNVLESDNIEYRCKIGTIFNNPWNPLENPNDKLDCTVDDCQGATRLLPDEDFEINVLGNQHTAECWFRLTWPVPCLGDFTDGMIYIYARAI